MPPIHGESTGSISAGASPCPHETVRRTARVALDIDAVLCDLIGSCRHTAAEYLGVPEHELTFGGDYFTPYHHDDPALVEKLRGAMWELWSREDTILRALPVPGGRDLAAALAGEGRLASYITRRPPQVDRLTARWLETHGFPLDGVELHHVGGTNACKSVTARAVHAEVLVDDSVHEAISALANGMHVVMVAMPYNRDAARELAGRYGPRFLDVPDTSAALAAVTANPCPGPRV